jgi:hypothetical protein
MELYRNTDLDKFKCEAPFFTHPYEHWNSYSFKPIDLLEQMADRLQNTTGFCERLEQARDNIKNPLNFFGFITELKVADFLKRSKCEPEFIVTNDVDASPDFKLCNELYVEVHTIQKYFFALVRAEEELQKIDVRFRFKRRMALPPSSNINWQEYFPKLKAEIENWKSKKLEKNPQTLIGDWAKENLVAELHDDTILRDADIHNAHGNAANTVIQYLTEAIGNKKINRSADTLKNDLNNCRPNVLWLEFLYLQDEIMMTDWQKFDFTQIVMPSDLDSIVVSVCGIDKGYDESEKLMLLLNEKISTDYSAKITQWFNSLSGKM